MENNLEEIVDTAIQKKCDELFNTLPKKCVDIELEREQTKLSSDNSRWFRAVGIGADLGCRVMLAYLMKHNMLDITKFIETDEKQNC